jgi:spermidine synthase
MKKRLLLLSFIEGAAVMCAELCGARLLAPIFGSSLYVWAAVMGITLAALAGGYFFGGIYSERPNQLKSLRNILLAAGLYLLIMPLLAHYALPRLSYLPFIGGMLLSTIILLFPSVFFLGASSPLFISLQTASETKAGRVSGTVYAVSTAGGILSTFVCGFYLIPDLGLNFTLVLNGLLLLGGAFLFLKGASIITLVIAAAFCYLGATIKKDPKIIYAADGIHGRIEVSDVLENGRPIRRLLVNGIIQTEIDPSTHKTTLRYVLLLDSLLSPAGHGATALILGAGGCSAANLLVKKGYGCIAVEFDKRIIEAAHKFFYADGAIKLVHDDARRFLNLDSTKYDLILVDVFKAEEQPSHVLTLESLKKIRAKLNPGAMLIVNWHGYTEGPLSEGTRVLTNTMHAAGFRTEEHFTGNDPDYRNTIYFAKMVETPSQEKIPELINTDNRPTMEKYNAKANKTWRTNYLRYYQGVRSAYD